MKKHIVIFILFFTAFTLKLSATIYYSDPVKGSMANDGSQNNPWGSLKAVFDAGKSFQAGDTLFLMSGAHGEAYISGTNSDYVCIAGMEGQTPKIASVLIQNAQYWAFKNLVFTTDGTGGSFSRTHILRSSTTASYLKVENCTFHSGESSASWTKADWYNNAEDAVLMEGTYSIFANNTVKNIYFGVEIRGDNSEITNNLIDNFGADAVRILGSSITCENNTIRDAYIEDYATNHDDAIQMYDYDNINNGLNSDIIIRNNIIFQFADPITQAMLDDNLVGYSMQGIIITDGHIENSIVENNLVVSDHYHGITLVGAINCRVQNNTVLKTPTSYNPTADANPWIQLNDDKNGNESLNSIIRNNLTTKLTPWTYPDAQNTTENNLEIATTDYPAYFSDVENFDFTLTETSPAIDAGVNTDLTITDLAGNPRLVGTLPDCGAYEYQGDYINSKPVLNPIGNQNITEGETKNIEISATDADGDDLSFTASNLPAFASLTDNNNNTATLNLSPQSGDSGNYPDIVITVSDGIDEDSESITIDVSHNTGVSVLESKQLKIYPNPTNNGSFTLSFPNLDTQSVKLSIYTLNGRLIYQKQIEKSSNQLKINTDLSTDIYLLQIQTENKIYYKKLIIN